MPRPGDGPAPPLEVAACTHARALVVGRHLAESGLPGSWSWSCGLSCWKEHLFCWPPAFRGNRFVCVLGEKKIPACPCICGNRFVGLLDGKKYSPTFWVFFWQSPACPCPLVVKKIYSLTPWTFWAESILPLPSWECRGIFPHTLEFFGAGSSLPLLSR